MLLPSYHRQIVLIDNDNATTLKVNKYHHPIVVFKERKRHIVIQAACRGVTSLKTVNVFSTVKDSWSRPQSMDSLSIERYHKNYQCMYCKMTS